MDEILRDSLTEIAALLLLLHENYLKEAHGFENVLASLVRFLDDAGLEDIVTVIDAEILRREVMGRSDCREMMGYDVFYAWLRQLAVKVFCDNGDGGRRALHGLLITYILPLAVGERRLSNMQSNSYAVEVAKCSTLDTMIQYYDFIRFWYASLESNVSCFQCVSFASCRQ